VIAWKHAVLALLARRIPVAYRDEVMADLEEERLSFLRCIVMTWRSGSDARQLMKEIRMKSPWQWSDFSNDARAAWRQHRAHPVGALAIIAILATAIGLNTALFSMVQGVLLQPLTFAEPDRVVFIWNTSSAQPRSPLAPARALDVRQRASTLEAAALIGHISMTVTGRGAPERWYGASVSSSFFDVLQAQPALGRTFSTHEPNRDVVVLSHRLWVDQFQSDPSIIGRPLLMNGRARVVSGVMPADFYWPSINDETSAENPPLFWTCAPLPDVPERPVVYDEDITKNRQMGFLRLVARLRRDTPVESARKELTALATTLATEYPETDGGRSLTMTPASEQLFGPVERPLLFVWLASGLVVLAACINAGNLLLVKLAGRRRELAVRSALGATRARLARQLVAEAFVLAIVAGVAGMALAVAALRLLIAITPVTVGRLDHVTIDGGVLAATVVATTLTGIVLGGLSAAALWRDRSADEVRAAGTAQSGGRRLRRLLVATEVAVAMMLFVGSMLFGQSLLRLKRVDIGFDSAQLLTFDVMLTGDRAEYQAKQLDFFNRFLDRVRALPGVRHAAGAVTLPIGGDDFGASVLVDGRPMPKPGDERKVGFQIVGSDWFKTLGMQLRRGRDFAATDTRQTAGVVVINEALAHLEWPDGDALGRRLRMGRETDATPLTVVGIVSDIRHLGPGSDARPEIYLPYGQMSLPMMAVAVRTAGDPMSLVSAIRAAAMEVDPTQPISGVATMDAHLKRSYGRAAFLSELTMLFGALALILAMIGVYGVTSFAVTQRTREFGVRAALGATPSQLVRTVMGESLAPVVVGVMAGLACAAASAQLIRTLLFGTATLEMTAYLTSAATLFATAVLASAVPARRAAQVDPVRALRDS